MGLQRAPPGTGSAPQVHTSRLSHLYLHSLQMSVEEGQLLPGQLLLFVPKGRFGGFSFGSKSLERLSSQKIDALTRWGGAALAAATVARGFWLDHLCRCAGHPPAARLLRKESRGTAACPSGATR